MAWIYLAESVASHLLCQNGCDQSPTVKLTHTVKESCSHRWPAEAFPPLQYGTISKPCGSMDAECLKSTSYMEGSPVRISVMQDLERAWREREADYFYTSSDCVAKLSRDSSFWKMYLPFVQGEERKWCGKLPRWGMIVDGALYPLQALERCTNAIDGFFWPTPTTQDAKNNGGPAQMRRNSLPLNAAIFATPRASQAAKLINRPCPSAQKGQHGECTSESVGRLNPSMIGKKLCPLWVSALMGYPTTHTDLKPWAMLWFQSKQKRPLKS